MRDKVFSYLGFAARTRNLVTGYNTCIMMMEKRKVKLLILTKDLAENTVKRCCSNATKETWKIGFSGAVMNFLRLRERQEKVFFGITYQHFRGNHL